MSDEGGMSEEIAKGFEKISVDIAKEDLERYQGYIGQRWKGSCKWFNVSKGFGFIIPDKEVNEYEDDVFVHQSALQMPGFRSLDEGENVEFTVRLGKRGLEAENVTGVKGGQIRGHSIRPLGKKKENLIRCYNCGRYGNHKAGKCKMMSRGEKVCYHCHQQGHLIADCPEKQKHTGPSNE